jgi:hypothetical protein
MIWETPEAWVPIPGYTGYEASSLGRVRSIDRLVHVTASHKAAAHCMVRKGRVLRPATHSSPSNNSGHLMLMLGRGRHLEVHVAVALAFHGPKPEYKTAEVLHLNHVPADNRPCNLKWGTRSENLKMDYANGIKRRWQ